MPKPMGLTWNLQVVRPTYAQDAIWDAVQEAQTAGMSVEQFKQEAAKAWEHYLDEKKTQDAKTWGES